VIAAITRLIKTAGLTGLLVAVALGIAAAEPLVVEIVSVEATFDRYFKIAKA